ncbi:hypothetical protein OAW24_00085 [bacterium]|jgi:uncharacterized membrane protein|nr:hypothetical protein [bacterium]|tara:strand:- start:66 stop:326 length:261 start_codon:yes stop_codon:yes gene_type:complete
MDIIVNPAILWNVIITVIVLPIGFLVRSILTEQNRLNILVNRTREEIARDYVTRDQIEKDFERIMDTITRIDEKLDRLQTKTYFQD